MNTRLLLVMSVAALSCGGERLSPTVPTGTGGRSAAGGTTGVGGTTGTGGLGPVTMTTAGGCPALGAPDEPCARDCSGAPIYQYCLDGGWVCPNLPESGCPVVSCASIPSGCECAYSTGLVNCPADGGAADAAIAGDAGAQCSPEAADPLDTCVSACGDDLRYGQVCVDGGWMCPPGTFNLGVCLNLI